MALQVIADDICYLVLRELDRRSDVSAFMRSSRSFYPIGVDHLLKMGVYIYTNKELVSFCQLMKRHFIDMHKPATQLKELTISVDWDDEEDAMAVDDSFTYESMQDLQGASLLVPVLGCLADLQRLTIEFCETLLECDKRLIHAFAALTTLGELHVTGFGFLTYQVVAGLRSYLRKVYVDCGDEVAKQPTEDRNLQSTNLLSPVQMLRRHQGTLQEVIIHVANMTARLPKQRSQTDDDVFSQVHTLALKRCHVIEREVIMNAFPNVNKLELFWMEASNAQEDPSMDMDEIRAMNLAYPKQWAPLDFVYADVDSLFTLGFKSRVGRLDVALWEFEDIDIEHLCTVLADVQPRRVVVQWGYWDAFRELSAEFSPDRLGQLFAGVGEQAISEITHFGLDVGLKNLTEDPVQYTDAVAQLLMNLPHVRCFTFRLHVVAREYEDEYAHSTPEDREDDVVEVLAAGFGDEVLTTLAVQIAAATVSVTQLYFVVMSRRIYWRVTRGAAGSDSVTRVSEAEGERLLAAEGMLWHCPSKIWWPRSPENRGGN